MAETPGFELELATTPNELAELLAGLRDAPEQTAEEAQAMRYGIIAEMLAAATEEDLWRELPTWSSKEVIGDTFEIRDVAAYRSKFKGQDGTTGGFLACRAINTATGEVGILNTGAARLAARIAWYKLHDKLPVRITVVERAKTADGYVIVDAELAQPLEKIG